MDPKQKLIDLAREATGDTDIAVAGDFQPKGTTWKVAAGAGAGAVLGDAVGATSHRRPATPSVPASGTPPPPRVGCRR